MTLRDEFERTWPWLDASLASFGRTHGKEHVWNRIAEGRAQLWPAERAVILTETIRHPIGLKSCNVWLQGGELEALKPMHPLLEQWARTRGYDRLIAWGRNGWLRPRRRRVARNCRPRSGVGRASRREKLALIEETLAATRARLVQQLERQSGWAPD